MGAVDALQTSQFPRTRDWIQFCPASTHEYHVAWQISDRVPGLYFYSPHQLQSRKTCIACHKSAKS